LIVGFLAKKAGFSGEAELKRALISLVKRKFAVNRGINGRLYEIKPDVINEFILSDWLTIEDGNQFRPSPEADEIVTLVINGEDGKPIPEVRIVARTLAEVELRRNGRIDRSSSSIRSSARCLRRSKRKRSRYSKPPFSSLDSSPLPE
jgi:hypothetical protein